MIYIAAPFFNEAQIKVVEDIKKILTKLGKKYYSPKDENPTVEKDETMSKELRQKIFNNNVDAMHSSNLAIAVIDDFDKGVLWEMGFLYCISVNILGFTNFADRGMNLMLQESIVDFAHGIKELEEKVNEWAWAETL